MKILGGNPTANSIQNIGTEVSISIYIHESRGKVHIHKLQNNYRVFALSIGKIYALICFFVIKVKSHNTQGKSLVKTRLSIYSY